jgi:hypothetical protein
VKKVVWRPLAWLLVREAVWYVRLKYGVDLAEAQPELAVQRTKVPILLIHGEADNETPPKHSEEIAARNPAIQLWLVPGAVHTGAYAAAPRQFESKVLAWFER